MSLAPAFALRDPWPWATLAGLTRLGEALGYGAVFCPEIRGRDAFAALMGLAAETTELRLATGVVPITAREPVVTAMAAATVQERSGGRFVLGIGAGPPRPGALEALRAQVASLRALLGTAAPARVSLALAAPPPIWVAALGPRAVRLAGEVADGVLLNWCTPERVAQARAEARGAAEQAGRDPDAVRVGVYVRACLERDEAAALAALRAAAGEYASYDAYARQFERIGLGDPARAAARAHAAGRPEDVPEELVRAVCLLGDPERARRRLQAYEQAGADVPVVYPVPAGPDPAGSVGRTLEGLAPLAGDRPRGTLSTVDTVETRETGGGP
ncbi:MAG: FMN-dependent monooxygenase [Actinomycetota bacterium]|nr:MAG: FMN-dependent monooxygenase [Actinomycetota bacterium]